MSQANITIGGDFCPIHRAEAILRAGNGKNIFGDLLPEIEKADIFVANLECPLIRRETPIRKNGPVLGASVECLLGLSNVPISAFAIANNHILDHGREGVASTLQSCAAAEIRTFGAGLDAMEARKPLILVQKGMRIGFLAAAENERCIAGDNNPGANSLDPIGLVRQMAALSDNVDFLVVLVHGGAEHYPLPTPRLQETCRFLVEQGADAVICQHSHCAGSYETYRGAPIVYGQGNLIFDFPNRGPEWHRGFLVRLRIQAKHDSTMELIPFTQFADAEGIRKMDPPEAQQLLSAIEQRSHFVQNEKSVRDAWQSYCAERSIEYFGTVLGHGRILRRLNRSGGMLGTVYGQDVLFKLNNVIQCEVHREILLTVFDQYLRGLERNGTPNL
jgi:hypothetical protein